MFHCLFFLFFCFKQKTAYEMRISDWSSDVCSSDLLVLLRQTETATQSECPAAAVDSRERTAGCDRQGARRAEGAGNPRAVGSECDSLYSFPARAARSGLDVLRCLAAVDVAEPIARLYAPASRFDARQARLDRHSNS